MNVNDRTHRWTPWALLLPLLFALPLGCENPFKPATPETPINGGDVVDEDFTTPEGLLSTVEAAIEARGQAGADTYLRAFAESTAVSTPAFRALYDAAVKQLWESGTHQTAPEPWGITLERNLHSKLSSIRPTADYTFTFEQDPDSPLTEKPTPDVQIWHQLYTLTAVENGTSEIIATGVAHLTLVNQQSRWFILRWDDRVNPKFGAVPPQRQYTFSRLRLDSLLGV